MYNSTFRAPTLQPWINTRTRTARAKLFANPYSTASTAPACNSLYHVVQMTVVAGADRPRQTRRSHLQHALDSDCDPQKGESRRRKYRTVPVANVPPPESRLPHLNFPDPVCAPSDRRRRFRRALSLASIAERINRPCTFSPASACPPFPSALYDEDNTQSSQR